MKLFGRAWLTTRKKPKNVINLVHGLGEHSGRYEHIAKAFNTAGYHLVSFDLRGHGLSEGKRGHSNGFTQLFDDIQTFLDDSNKRFGFDLDPFLYGHSLGASLVINFGLIRDANLSGVIASAPSLKLAYQPSKVKLFFMDLFSKLIPSLTMSNDLKPDHLSHDKAIVKAYQDDVLVHDQISAKLAAELFQYGDYALSHARDCKFPLLLMHGSADKIASYDSSKIFAERSNGNVECIIWENFYHEIHNELGKEKVINKMIAWCDQIQVQG